MNPREMAEARRLVEDLRALIGSHIEVPYWSDIEEIEDIFEALLDYLED